MESVNCVRASGGRRPTAARSILLESTKGLGPSWGRTKDLNQNCARTGCAGLKIPRDNLVRKRRPHRRKTKSENIGSDVYFGEKGIVDSIAGNITRLNQIPFIVCPIVDIGSRIVTEEAAHTGGQLG